MRPPLPPADTQADPLAGALRDAAASVDDPRLTEWVEQLIAGDQPEEIRPSPEPGKRRR